MSKLLDPVSVDSFRRKLMLGLPGGLALASPLAFLGCGGGGSDGAAGAGPGSGTSDADKAAIAAIVARLPAVARTAQRVTVTLPAGSGVTLAGTQLVSANNVSQVAGDGTAGVVVVSGAPQMSYVFDATGRLLLMGVIEAGVRTTLDSRSTAEALLLLACEAGAQGPAIEVALRRALAGYALVDPVRLAVEGAAARNGIDPGDTALMDALQTAIRLLRAGTMAPAGTSRKQARAVTSQPGSGQSGITVENAGDFNNLQLKNSFRRRTRAWMTQTGYYDASGNLIALPAPVLVIPDFALDATTALSFDNLVIAIGDYVAQMAQDIGFLGKYEAGNEFWSPVSSAEMFLTVGPDAAEVAVYRARVVGIGTTDGGTLSGDEAAALESIMGATLWLDIVQPFIKNLILPMISERIPASATLDFEKLCEQIFISGVTDLSSLAVAGTYFPATVNALRAGNIREVVTQFLTEFFSSNTFQGLFELGLRAIVQASGAGPWTIRDGNGTLVGVNLLENEDLIRQNVAKLKAGLGKLARIIQLIKLATLVGDYGAIAKDWSASSRVSELTINVSKATVALSPKPLKVSALAGTAGQGRVTASVTDIGNAFPAENIFLEWKCTGQYGDLIKLGGGATNDFESVLTSPTHDYIPSGIDDDPDKPDTIKVTAFYRNPTTAARVEMGSAQVTVEFKEEFNLGISPAQTQDVPADADFPVTAFIKEGLPPGATVDWSWSPSGVGSLTAPPPDANPWDSVVVFHSGSSEGSATVTARATVTVAATASTPQRVVVVKPASARLKVKKGMKTIVMEATGGSFACTDPLACGVSEYGAFIVPVIAKATNYTAVLSGFNYPGCNRTVSWISPKGDGGDCNFPVTYHPHNSKGATNFWAVWVSFGGAPEGKCVVTITLAP